MNAILFAESMEIEFNQIFTEFENNIAYANARLMEDGLIPSYISENAEQKKSGGLVGFVKRMIEGLIRMLTDTGKKFKSLLFGSEVDPDKANEEVQCEKNPNGVIQLLNGMKYKDVIQKCVKGEMSVEEAKDFCEKQNTAFGAIGAAAISAASLFGIAKTSEKYMGKWKAELDEAFEIANAELTAKAEDIARARDSEEKEKAIKQAVDIVLNHMSSITGKGIKAIEGPIRKMYAENYVRERLTRDAGEMTTVKGRVSSAMRGVKKAASTIAETYDLKLKGKNVDAYVDQQEKIQKNQDKLNQARNKERNKFHRDKRDYVEPGKIARAASYQNPATDDDDE